MAKVDANSILRDVGPDCLRDIIDRTPSEILPWDDYSLTEPPLYRQDDKSPPRTTITKERRPARRLARESRLTFGDPPSLAARCGGRQCGKNQWTAHCPCHDDREASMSIRWGRNDETIVKCHAGCSQKALLAKFRKLGFRLKREPPPKAKRPKRVASVSTSIASMALTLNERRMFDLLQAERAKAPDGALRMTYNQFCEASVRRQSIPSGLRAMEALGLIVAKRSPFNIRESRYEMNAYRLVDGWQTFDPEKSSQEAKKAALDKARKVASNARKTKR